MPLPWPPVAKEKTPLAPAGEDAPRYQPWRARSSARVTGRGEPLFDSACEFGRFARDDEDEEDDDDEAREEEGPGYGGALWTSPASVLTDLDADADEDADAVSAFSSMSSSSCSSRSASGASSTTSSMASLSPEYEYVRGGALTDDPEYADADELDQNLNLDGHGRLRRAGGRARGRLHVRFSDDDALLSPISPLSPLPAVGNYDNNVDQDDNATAISLSPLSTFSALPEWDLPPLDAYIPLPLDVAAVDGDADPHADIDAYVRSPWLRNAGLPLDEGDSPPPLGGEDDLPPHLRGVAPHHAELPPDEDDVLPEEDDIPTLPHNEDDSLPIDLPPEQENATVEKAARKNDDEDEDEPPLSALSLFSPTPFANRSPEAPSLMLLNSDGIYTPLLADADVDAKDDAVADADPTTLVDADAESSTLHPPALVRAPGDIAAPSPMVAPAGPQVSVEAAERSTNAPQDESRGLGADGGAYSHSWVGGEGVYADADQCSTLSILGSEENETPMLSSVRIPTPPPSSPPPENKKKNATPAYLLSPHGTSMSLLSPTSAAAFLHSSTSSSASSSSSALATPTQRAPPSALFPPPALHGLPHLTSPSSMSPTSSGTDIHAPWALFPPLGLGTNGGEPPASPSRRRSTELPVLGDDVFGLRTSHAAASTEMGGVREDAGSSIAGPSGVSAPAEPAIWGGGGLGLQLDADELSFPRPTAGADADADDAFALPARVLAALPPDGEARRVLELRQRHRAGSLGFYPSAGSLGSTGASGSGSGGSAGAGGDGAVGVCTSERERERDREKARELGALLRVKLGLDADASGSAANASAPAPACTAKACCARPPASAAVDRLVASMVLARQADAARRRPVRARTWSPSLCNTTPGASCPSSSSSSSHTTTLPSVCALPSANASVNPMLSSASVSASVLASSDGTERAGRAKTPRSPLRQELLPDGEEDGEGEEGWASLASLGLVDSPGALSPLCLGAVVLPEVDAV